MAQDSGKNDQGEGLGVPGEGLGLTEIKPIGRPSNYSPELADEICELLMLGEPIRQICLLPHMPAERTFYAWLARNEDFQQKYARAKEFQTYKFDEDLVDISDDARNDWVERENQRTGATFIALNEQAIARSKLMVETRKWLMGKHKPKKYGDRVTNEHVGADGGAIKTEVKSIAMTPEQMKEEAERRGLPTTIFEK